MKMGLNARVTFTLAAVVWGLAALPSKEARAQVPYDIALDTAAYNPINNATSYTPTAYALGYDIWDEGAAEVPLPFAFQWFGRGYRSIWVYSNGFLSFDAPPSGQAVNILAPPGLIPNPTNVPHNFIAPLWQDLESAMIANAPPSISAVVQGSSPNRIAIIEVSGLRRSHSPSSSVEFQVRLEERTNSVEILYAPGNFGVAGASVAIEDAFGTQGANLLENTPGCGQGCVCNARSCNSADVITANAITIRPPVTAELIGSIEGPAGAYPGDVFTATVSVSNVGLAAAGAFTAEVRLSNDATIDASDRLLRTVNIPGLAAGVTSSQTVSLTMPAGLPVARFYLGLIIDPANAVHEAVESNNSIRDPDGIVTGPDLFGTVAAALASGPGETLNIQLGLRSKGAPVRGPVHVTLLLSHDAAVSGDDYTLSDANYTLPDGFALDTVVPVIIPVMAPGGAYRILAVLDPMNAISEIDENNNLAVSPAQVTLSLPDLEAEDVVSGPVAFRGTAFPVTAHLTNRGGGTARNFTSCLVISRNPLINLVSDPVLARTPVMTLEAGGSQTLRFEPMIAANTSTGTWELAIVADCDEQVAENLETNNVKRRSPPITIRDPAADFTPVMVVTASTGAAGEGLAVSALIGNYGTARGAAQVRLVLSTAPAASLSDPQIYETPTPITLEPGEEHTVSVFAPLPGDLASGSYTVGVIVDPEASLDEVDETNNIITSRAIPIVGSNLAIVSPPPPNAVIRVSYVWRFRAIGADAPIQWSIHWSQDHAPPGLSFDTMKGELTGSATAEGSYEMTISASAGNLVASMVYPFLVTPPNLPLQVVSAKLPAALQHERYSVRLVAVGGTPPYVWTLENGHVPTGLGLTESGEIGGEPATPGAYTFDVRVTDTQGISQIGSIALDVIDPAASLSINTADVPSAMVGEAYSVLFEADGGTEPYTWKLDGLVPGLSFDTNSHTFAGTPTVAGSYPLVVEVHDGRGLLDRNAYVLRVFELGELSILTGHTQDNKLPDAKLGVLYQTADGQPVTLKAANKGGTAISGLMWLVALGQLPPGLILDGGTGVISGTPTTEGTYAFTVLAHDGSGDSDRATLAIVVSNGEAPMPVASSGCGCSAGRPSGSAEILVFAALLWLVRRRRR